MKNGVLSSGSAGRILTAIGNGVTVNYGRDSAGHIREFVVPAATTLIRVRAILAGVGRLGQLTMRNLTTLQFV